MRLSAVAEEVKKGVEGIWLGCDSEEAGERLCLKKLARCGTGGGMSGCVRHGWGRPHRRRGWLADWEARAPTAGGGHGALVCKGSGLRSKHSRLLRPMRKGVTVMIAGVRSAAHARHSSCARWRAGMWLCWLRCSRTAQGCQLAGRADPNRRRSRPASVAADGMPGWAATSAAAGDSFSDATSSWLRMGAAVAAAAGRTAGQRHQRLECGADEPAGRRCRCMVDRNVASPLFPAGL